MNYRKDRYGSDISILGFGCMRFPRSMGRIDMAETEREIVAAVEAGINYFDTAYIYGGSEAALGEILEKNNLRQRVKIATKLPHYLIKSREGLEKCFTEQLRRLRTDHIDYYLMHMLSDTDTWEKLKALGMEDWIAEKKQLGQIGQVGFSYHGMSDMFCALLDAYDWDFCQIQYNYMDEHSQAGRRGLLYAHEKGLPVIIMEPLRGGKLAANLPAKAQAIFDAAEPKRSAAHWAFRWLWDQKEVSCVLSGMNSMEMLRENIAAASEAAAGDLSEADQAMLRSVAAAINEKMPVGCTGCGYCMPCPKGVDIPGTFAAYNRSASEGRFSALKEYTMCTAMRRQSSAASNCIGCGKCESHCPQSLPIRQHLSEAAKTLEGPLYKAARFFIRLIKAY